MSRHLPGLHKDLSSLEFQLTSSNSKAVDPNLVFIHMMSHDDVCESQGPSVGDPVLGARRTHDRWHGWGSEDVQEMFPTNMEVQQDPIVEGANVDRMLTDAIFHSHDTRSDRNGSIDQGFLSCT